MSLRTLRGLSRAYASGALDRESYRQQRRELLRLIATGELPVTPFRPPEPEARTLFPYDEDDGDTTQEIVAPNTPMRAAKARTARVMLPIVLVAGAALAAAWAGLHYLRNDAAPPVVTAPAPRPPDIIDAFLAANSWSGGAINNLQAGWDQLDPATQARMHASSSMRRLAEALLAQIQSESALVDLGEAEEALDTQEQLLDLSEHIGINDDRFGRARQTWITARERALAAHQPAPIDEGGVDTAASDAVAAADGTARPESAAEPAAIAAPAQEAAEVEAPAAVAVAAATEPAPTAVSDPTPTPASTPPTAPAPKAAATPKPPATAAKAAPVQRKTARARTNCKAELVKSRRPYCMDILASGSKGPVLVVLPPGQFEMGGERAPEQPRHTVSLDRPFAMAMFEVSAGELAAFCKATGSTCPEQPWSDPALPAVNVSWPLTQAYAAWLSEVTQAQYRLPSEAEWEYAARAGTTTLYPFGSELVPTHARYSFKSPQTTPVAANDRTVNRNAFRLYHMIGNVREWVQDAWSPSFDGAAADGSARNAAGSAERVVRGGSYADGADALRSSARMPLAADSGDRYTGFRVVRALE